MTNQERAPLAGNVAIVTGASSGLGRARDHSPEYTPLRELRTTTGRNAMMLVDGLGADDTERPARWAAMKRARSAELETHEAHAQRGDRTDTTERTGPRSAAGQCATGRLGATPAH